MAQELGRLPISRLTGAEPFRDGETDLGFNVLSFWQWSASDLVSNATRGRLAEFIVAQALGISINNIRDEWAAYDLRTSDDVAVEVKSAAYLQSWHQRTESRITFRVPMTRSWDPDTNQQSKVAQRQADVYVFALLAHREKSTLNPLDAGQWRFYVLPTSALNERTRSQHSITIPSLTKLCRNCVDYYGLAEAVAEAARIN